MRAFSGSLHSGNSCGSVTSMCRSDIARKARLRFQRDSIFEGYHHDDGDHTASFGTSTDFTKTIGDKNHPDNTCALGVVHVCAYYATLECSIPLEAGRFSFCCTISIRHCTLESAGTALSNVLGGTINAELLALTIGITKNMSGQLSAISECRSSSNSRFLFKECSW
jgi:hypothetical protein